MNKHLTTCYICENKRLRKFLSLGDQPPSDAFVRREDLEKPEARFPLSLNFCEGCGLVQLGHVVDPKTLFTEYVYTTGMNNSLRANFKTLVEKLVERFKLGKNDFAVDVGSNDGTLLSNYAPLGIKILGIDPSSAGEIARERGIPTLAEFFNAKTAEKVAREHGKAGVITATNVFAHVADLDSFMRGIKALLAPDGVFVSESGYLLDMLQTLGYDAVYHEHLRYYSLRPLQRLFERFGMEVFDAERIPSHNGSIRIFAGRTGAYPIKRSVSALLETEEKAGLYRLETFSAFGTRVAEHGAKLKGMLARLTASGKRIAGVGAPAKGNTLLNFVGATTKDISYLVEKSEHKIGLFAPGTRIPVVAEEVLLADQPEYALMFSWNLSKELIPKLRANGYRGRFIIPFPKIRIVNGLAGAERLNGGVR